MCPRKISCLPPRTSCPLTPTLGVRRHRLGRREEKKENVVLQLPSTFPTPLKKKMPLPCPGARKTIESTKEIAKKMLAARIRVTSRVTSEPPSVCPPVGTDEKNGSNVARYPTGLPSPSRPVTTSSRHPVVEKGKTTVPDPEKKSLDPPPSKEKKFPLNDDLKRSIPAPLDR